MAVCVEKSPRFVSCLVREVRYLTQDRLKMMAQKFLLELDTGLPLHRARLQKLGSDVRGRGCQQQDRHSPAGMEAEQASSPEERSSPHSGRRTAGSTEVPERDVFSREEPSHPMRPWLLPFHSSDALKVWRDAPIYQVRALEM